MTQKWSSRPKPDRAARARENQRRHRAKTKAYIADLESEVASMRTRLGEVLEQNARLVAEVEQLRARVGDRSRAEERTDRDVTSLPVQAPASRQNPTLSSQIPTTCTIQDLQPSSTLTQAVTHTPLRAPSAMPSIPRSPRLPPNPTLGPSSHRAPSQSLASLPSNDKSCAVDMGVCPSLCGPYTIPSLENLDISALRTSCSHLPPARPGESTIPCTTAYTIITQQNYGGHDLMTIAHRLGPGFRRAEFEGDDCRVISSFVFAVIDTISSP